MKEPRIVLFSCLRVFPVEIPCPSPKTLVIIESDPRTSRARRRPSRIAAGIGVWKKTDVTLCCAGPVAGYSLQEYADELVDEDNFTPLPSRSSPNSRAPSI